MRKQSLVWLQMCAALAAFNMPNHVVLAEAVKPGDKSQIAIFGINGRFQ
jgi:hypothetical protein